MFLFLQQAAMTHMKGSNRVRIRSIVQDGLIELQILPTIRSSDVNLPKGHVLSDIVIKGVGGVIELPTGLEVPTGPTVVQARKHGWLGLVYGPAAEGAPLVDICT